MKAVTAPMEAVDRATENDSSRSPKGRYVHLQPGRLSGCASRVIPLRAGSVVMPSHTVGRHAHQLGATGYHSLGSAWPTVSRSGRRIASALQSRGGNRGILGGTGETPPGVLERRPLSGSPRTVVSCRPCVYLPSRKGPLRTVDTHGLTPVALGN